MGLGGDVTSRIQENERLGDTAVRRDREFAGALAFAAALGATFVMGYAFNAIVARRLTEHDFGTFGALLGLLLAFSGPVTALLGGAAMSAARTTNVPRSRWRRPAYVLAAVAAFVGLAPIPDAARAGAFFLAAAAASMPLGWNRGLFIGFGRIGLAGATMAAEGLARIAFMLLFLAAGWGLPGAAAGLALGIALTSLVTETFVPNGDGEPEPVGPDVRTSVAGLLFLGIIQFADVTAVRLVGPSHAGLSASASSVARLVLYSQLPAAAYALRRTAVVGARRAVGRSMLLALAPALLATVILEIAPGRIISATYGGRYGQAVGLVRILAPAMLLSGLALVLVHLLMGAGRTAWAWSMSIVGVAGLGAVFAVAGSPVRAAVAMLVVQGSVLALAATHARRLVGVERTAGRSVLILNWRDRRHPQGGGSEVYVECVALRLAELGWGVTVFCGGYEGALREEIRGGVRYLRRGSRFNVYAWGVVYHLLGRYGPHDVVIDVQNGIPFFSPLYCGRPVVLLVHHVHREQWWMWFRPRVARLGWWLEAKLSPRLYRRARYITVSESTRDELVSLGVSAGRISVARNGAPDVVGVDAVAKTAEPTLVYVGRLVPHKRIELLLRAVAELRARVPGLTVRVVGRGPGEEGLRALAAELGIADMVRFDGYVDEATKTRILTESWALVLPSVKEGWGLAITEAAANGTPAVAFRVPGLSESVLDGTTGLLAGSFDELVSCLRRVLTDRELRTRMGEAARAYSLTLTWDTTSTTVAGILDGLLAPATMAPVMLPAVAEA